MPRPEINWAKRRLWTAGAIIAERAALNGEPPPMPRHLNPREWLEELRTYASVDGDRARELLERLDEADELEMAVERWEAYRDGLLELMVSAGLLNEGDTTTDPLPLLAMFLPVD